MGGAGGLVYLRYGREPRVDYDREYEQEPPTELSPAEVGALVTQGAVTEKQFTATLFDLIRRGVITAEPTQVDRVTWAGMRHEQITDLVLGLTDQETELRDFEQSVMTVLRRALELGPRPLHELNEAIQEDRASNAQTYQVFRDRVLGGDPARKPARRLRTWGVMAGERRCHRSRLRRVLAPVQHLREPPRW